MSRKLTPLGPLGLLNLVHKAHEVPPGELFQPGIQPVPPRLVEIRIVAQTQRARSTI